MTKKTARRNRRSVLKVGVIGVGGMGRSHCTQIAEKIRETKLTAVCDVHAASSRDAGKMFGVPHFTTHEDLIKSELCDAVIIASPHPQHMPPAIACMSAGLHVLSEKPLADTIGNAEKMVRAARRNKVVFAVMFQRRFEPVIEKALALVREGRIGRILRATMVSPEFRTQAYYDSGTWRATWAGEGGGVMLNQAPHIMDIFVHLAGMPETVRGTIATTMHRIEVEDRAEATMTFKGGGTGYLYCSTNEPGPGQMIEIFGEKGKLTFRNSALTFTEYLTPISRFMRESDQMWATPPQKEAALRFHNRSTGTFSGIRNFARHILFKEPLVCPAESGLASLELANAIALSSFQGKEVRIPISRNAYDRLLAALRKSSKFKKSAVKELRTTDPRHAR